jgi:hypothetical protein
LLSEKLLNWIVMRELATTETERETRSVKPAVLRSSLGLVKRVIAIRPCWEMERLVKVNDKEDLRKQIE